MFEVIVLGATFAAAGIAKKFKEKCLVIERRAQAGYEYFGALRYTAEESAIYPCFENSNILFCTEVVSVEKTEEGFTCLTHGVKGFGTYTAGRVIDTRCSQEMCLSKTYNLLISSEEAPDFTNARWEETEEKGQYLVCCPVPLDCSYGQARTVAQTVICQFSPTQRLILSASEFDYAVKQDDPGVEGDVLYLPSKAYGSPMLALKAGEGVQ